MSTSERCELSPGQVEISEEAERALGGPKVIEAMNVISTRPKDWSEPARSILFRREPRMES